MKSHALHEWLDFWIKCSEHFSELRGKGKLLH